MRWAIAMAALVAATPVSAQRIAIDRSVYLERSVGGAMQVESATQLRIHPAYPALSMSE